MAKHAPITGARSRARPTLSLSAANRPEQLQRPKMIIPGQTPPIALLRSLPAGPLAIEYQRLKRLADLFAAFDRDDMEVGIELLIAELDARDGDADREDGDEDRCRSGDDHVGSPPSLFGRGDGHPGDPEDTEDGDEDLEHDGREEECRGNVEYAR